MTTFASNQLSDRMAYRDALVAKIRELGPVFAERAVRYDREASFPFENFDDLYDAGCIAQVEEGDAAVVASASDPSTHGHGLPGVVGSQLTGSVRAHHERVCLSERPVAACVRVQLVVRVGLTRRGGSPATLRPRCERSRPGCRR